LGTILLAAFPASGAVLTEYPLPAGSLPNFIVAGPDGKMWFTEYGRDKIASITSSGTITEYPTQHSDCGPVGITLGGDGNLFYTCVVNAGVGLFTMESGIASELLASSLSAVGQPAGPIAAGLDGNLWYTRTDTVAGTVTTFLEAPTPVSPPSIGTAFGIAAGGDGHMWFTASSFFSLGPSLVGVKGNEFTAIPAGPNDPYAVTWCAGRGKVVWADPTANKIQQGSLDFAATTTILPAGAGPEGVACAADGTIYFTAASGNYIGIVTSGYAGNFPVPTAGSVPYGIAMGPDGSIWFTENTGNKIGRIQLSPKGDVDGNGKLDLADVFYLVNFLFANGPPPK